MYNGSYLFAINLLQVRVFAQLSGEIQKATVQSETGDYVTNLHNHNFHNFQNVKRFCLDTRQLQKHSTNFTEKLFYS